MKLAIILSLFIIPIYGNITTLSTKQINTIIEELERENYDVLDIFVSTKTLFPYTKIRDGYTVDRYGTNYTITFEKTNHISFNNVGETISYTNQFGVLFLEPEKLLVPLAHLTNLRVSKCTGFEWAMETIYSATNLESILKVDQCFFIDGAYKGIILFEVIEPIRKYLLSQTKNQELISRINSLFDKQFNNIYMYIINKIPFNNFQQQKISIINSFIFSMLKDPYNTGKISPSPFQDNEICYIEINQ